MDRRVFGGAVIAGLGSFFPQKSKAIEPKERWGLLPVGDRKHIRE